MEIKPEVLNKMCQIDADYTLIRTVSDAMSERLREARNDGHQGWYRKEGGSAKAAMTHIDVFLESAQCNLSRSCSEQDLIDVINYCAMALVRMKSYREKAS